MTVNLLSHIGSGDLVFLFVLVLSSSMGITSTGSGYSGSDLGVVSCSTPSSIPDTNSFSFKSQKSLWFLWIGIFHSDHLIPLLMITLLVSGLCSLYISLVWFSKYPTMISFYVLSFGCPLIFSLFMIYEICQNSDKKPMILGIS